MRHVQANIVRLDVSVSVALLMKVLQARQNLTGYGEGGIQSHDLRHVASLLDCCGNGQAVAGQYKGAATDFANLYSTKMMSVHVVER
eukprot:m.101608 g.101608  ORF g.101608 m.101608 type:complete len:87 (+) comp15176_c0_seq8:872-1132(+)